MFNVVSAGNAKPSNQHGKGPPITIVLPTQEAPHLASLMSSVRQHIFFGHFFCPEKSAKIRKIRKKSNVFFGKIEKS